MVLMLDCTRKKYSHRCQPGGEKPLLVFGGCQDAGGCGAGAESGAVAHHLRLEAFVTYICLAVDATF
jgi:hypothetical protein